MNSLQISYNDMGNKLNMKYRLLSLLLILIVTGCAQTPPPSQQAPTDISWESQISQLEQLNDWSFSGKLGVFSPEGRDSVNINWQQSKNNFHIILTATLGVNVLDINKTDDFTVIIDGETYQSSDLDMLITELSGMRLPIQELQQWIKGNPSGASYQLDENKQLVSLLGGQKNTGLWLISYSDFRYIENINLPHSLQLTRGDLRLKFKISNWEIPLQNNK
ncbi:lipoprotein insertase outer membrane protein LolB [Psychromonas sp. KJ10-10]|uniref:lipoprotein insertase outer membrane protein LolB n=1 Tax=Psychromonas sp. KJ10-10 TaxID=3391823 RepID=UPI0039B56AE7